MSTSKSGFHKILRPVRQRFLSLLRAEFSVKVSRRCAAVRNNFADLFKQHRRAVKVNFQNSFDGRLARRYPAAFTSIFICPKLCAFAISSSTELLDEISVSVASASKPASTSVFAVASAFFRLLSAAIIFFARTHSARDSQTYLACAGQYHNIFHCPFLLGAFFTLYNLKLTLSQ